MVLNFCVKNCKSFWHPNANLSLFKFPFKRPEIVEKWLAVVPSQGNISQTSVICNKHFQNTDFSHQGTRRCLKNTAVPSIFPSDGSIKHGSPEMGSNGTTEIQAGSSAQNIPNVLKSNSILTNRTNMTSPGGRGETENPVILDNLSQGKHSQPAPKFPKTPVESLNYVTMPRERADAMRRQILILQKKNRQLERKYRNVTELVKDLKKKDTWADLQLEELRYSVDEK